MITIDGGESKLFARFLASRLRGTSAQHRQEIDAMVVTHGDADHFSGLPEILESETNKDPDKRLFAHPKRVFHNGLVKRPRQGAAARAARRDGEGRRRHGDHRPRRRTCSPCPTAR